LRDNARHHAYVSDIFVTDNWRRKGVARALLQAIENKMHERGCRRFEFAPRQPTSPP
jgi:GNAT superfamily N-acetyltransferase